MSGALTYVLSQHHNLEYYCCPLLHARMYTSMFHGLILLRLVILACKRSQAENTTSPPASAATNAPTGLSQIHEPYACP